MGKAVIDHLTQYCDLPQSGFLAGQSVTSALLALYGDGQRSGPVNDVDVFFLNDMVPHGLRPSMHRLDSTTQQDSSQDLEVICMVNHYVSQQIWKESGRNITDVYRLGLLNVIHLKEEGPTASEPKEDQAGLARLINTFDFNLVSVGVDLADGSLQWDPSFEQFLSSGVAEVDNHRSIRTFARALKKQDEMPWIDWDMPKIAKKIFVYDLVTANTNTLMSSIIIHPSIIALLDRFDPNKNYPRPATHGLYPPSAALGMSYPVVRLGPDGKNSFGLPSESDVLAFRTSCSKSHPTKTGQIEALATLLERGFPVDFPLNKSMECGLQISIENDQPSVYDLLSARGSKYVPAMHKNTPLHMAAAFGAVDFIKNAGQATGPIDEKANDGRTALNVAAFMGTAATCQAIIDRGARIEGFADEVEDGFTPLLDSIGRNGPLESTKTLLENGANAKATTKTGRTAFHLLASRYDDSKDNLELAIILKERGVDVHEATKEEGTPLYYAAKRNITNACKVLLKVGADMRGLHMSSPFKVALEMNHFDVAALFVAEGFTVPSISPKPLKEQSHKILSLSQPQAIVFSHETNDLLAYLNQADNGFEESTNERKKRAAFSKEMKIAPNDLIEFAESSDMQEKANVLRTWVARKAAMDVIAELDGLANISLKSNSGAALRATP